MPKTQEDKFKKVDEMKKKTLPKMLALTISMEMILSPLAMAADVAPPSRGSDSTASSEKVIETINSIGNLTKTVLNIKNGSNYQLRAQTDLGFLGKQQQPLPDKFFNSQKLSQIPGLGNYLALNGINPQTLECATLPTTLHEVKSEACEIGVTGDRGVPPQLIMNEMLQYRNAYMSVEKTYKNFQADSNVGGQAFGVGCMKNAMKVLNGFFQYRVNELDKLTANLEKMNADFKEASKTDLDAIEEALAVLEGGDSEIASKVKARRPDLLDFGKRFENPACKALYSTDTLNEMGKEGGLNSIAKDLRENFKKKEGKYSAEDYSQSHANVVADINNFVEKASKQAELKFSSLSEGDKGYSSFMESLKGLSSSTGINGSISPDLLSDVQTRFVEKNQKLTTEVSEASEELVKGGVDTSRVLSFMRNPNSSNFDNELNRLENQLKYNCLRGQSNVDAVLSKIYDPRGSKFANENASNFLKDKIRSIINNDNTTSEQKLAELKTIEESQGNTYLLRMENSYEVNDIGSDGRIVKTVIKASNRRTPSLYFSDIIRNCEAQYKANKLNVRLSGAAAIEKLKASQIEYKNLVKTHSNDLRGELKKKLIECNDAETATNSRVGSCTPTAFNTSKPGLCANAALSCSQNMKGCNELAQKFASEIKTQKTARVNNYKNMVEKNRKDVLKIFDTALSQYMKEGEALRGIFGAGFSAPTGIEREIKGDKYLPLFTDATASSLDGKLLLEDPEKFIKLFQSNVDKLKRQIVDQQNQILGGNGGSGLLADHIKQTGDNYRAVIGQANRLADTCSGSYQQALRNMNEQRAKADEERNKVDSELGEQLPSLCRRFKENADPVPTCAGDLKDLIKSGYKAANRGSNAAYDRERVTELETFCAEYSNENKNELTAYDICVTYNKDEFNNNNNDLKNLYGYCKALMQCKPTSVQPKVGDTNPPQNSVVNNCDKEKEIALAEYKKIKRNNPSALESTSTSISLSEPSFCVAGNTSQTANKVDAFNNVLNSFIKASAQ